MDLELGQPLFVRVIPVQVEWERLPTFVAAAPFPKKYGHLIFEVSYLHEPNPCCFVALERLAELVLFEQL